MNSFKVAIVPEHRIFDFRHPNLVQEFKVKPESALLMEFLLLVKGSRNRGLFSLFFKLNAGLDVYFGNEKVFNFEQHGFNDEVDGTYSLQEHSKSTRESNQRA